MRYFVYLLLCKGGSYYTGITTDVFRRFAAHQSGRGAAYTRSHPPIRIVYQEVLPDKGSALRREHELKKLTHAQKHTLALL